jgi:hypothetical protein
VNPGMACCAEGEEISLGIRPGLATELHVVDFKIQHRAARLASPAIPAEDLASKLVVQFAVQA